jgi:hypothetical protein
MSLNDKIDEANKSEFSTAGSGWLKMKEGLNQFRILTEPEVIFENYGKGICYHECGYEGSPKYLARVLDRADNKVKLYKIPFTIFETIAGFEKDDELQFSGFPMPYDVKVEAKGAGTKEVKYTVLPSLKRVNLEQSVLDFLSKQKSLKDVIKLMQDKNIEKHKTDGTWDAQQKKLANERSRTEKQEQYEKDHPMPDYPEEEINPEDIPF